MKTYIFIDKSNFKATEIKAANPGDAVRALVDSCGIRPHFIANILNEEGESILFVGNR